MKRRGFAFILAVSLVMSSLPGCEREDDGETTGGGDRGYGRDDCGDGER